MKVDNKLYDVKGIAAVLSISARTLWRWIQEGQFPKPDIKRDKFVRWKPETLQDWIDQEDN